MLEELKSERLMSKNLPSWKPIDENQGALLPGRIDIFQCFEVQGECLLSRLINVVDCLKGSLKLSIYSLRNCRFTI